LLNDNGKYWLEILKKTENFIEFQYWAGVITAKTILPITKLNFGRTQLSSSSGAHTLGRFECSGGDTTVTGMPTSCEDLWRMGHSLSGLYFVMEGKLVKNVYCDFTKLSGEAGT
jgi:hypothetical protein